MKKLLIIAGVLVAFVAAGFVGMRIYTKSFSPEGLAQYAKDDVNISVTYGRPFKKGRVIFDGLVPYGEVWRTGANEATTFTTNVDLMVAGKLLNAGTYSLFTIPNKDSWEIIFNKTIPNWGVGLSGKPARDTDTDALIVEVAAIETSNMFEQLTIDFEEMKNEVDLVIMWDETLVVVPMKPKKD